MNDLAISEAVARDEKRLRNFIRSRVPDLEDAEDILQDVFYELVAAVRVMQPIEQLGAWLFRVARNRITDRHRTKKQHEAVDDFLPSPRAGPDADYANAVLFEEIAAALDELPPEQREVFIAHELEGRSFKELSADTGVSINTLLSRKHYAVLHLRRRLRDIHEELTS